MKTKVLTARLNLRKQKEKNSRLSPGVLFG